jgi:hypothetical protein
MNGRGRVECKFSLQTMVRAHENLYQHLLQKHPQATS